MLDGNNLEVVTGVLGTLVAWFVMKDMDLLYLAKIWFEYLTMPIPDMKIELTDVELNGVKTEPHKTTTLVNPKSKDMIQCFDPSTKQLLGEVKAMNKDEIHEIIVKAKKAQESWKNTTFAQRRQVLRTIQKFIVSHTKEICLVSSRDSGKPAVDALLGEILTTCEKIRTICANGEQWLRKDYRTTGPMMMHKTAYVEYMPLGVIAAIAPWNYPFHNSINHVISGLFAGNAVVGKVSEHTSFSVRYYSEIIQTALKIHGHDPNLVQTITGFGDAGAALVSDPLVDKVIFTGSTPIGKLVMEGAAKNLTPVILELGGKDPLVIMNDVKNVESVMPFVMRGCYQNAGQNCVGVERVFVYESIYDEFVDKIIPRVKAMRQGNPVCNKENFIDCGSMIMPRQLEIIQDLVDDAIQKGATCHCGGQPNTLTDETKKGQYYQPTILSGVTPDMKIFQNEAFGPIMTIIKVPNDSDEECIKLVNNSEFGLASSIYGENANRALQVGRQFRTGMLTVNDYASNYLIQSLPFGGVGQSGFGRFAGVEGLRALCLERSIVVDTFPSIARTSIPPPLDYPIDADKGIPFVESLVQLFYNESIVAKLKGILGLIKNG